MPTYVTLLRFTQKGAETIKEGPSRLDAAKGRFRAAGAELKAFYLTLGRYDFVTISEFPDDETAAKAVLSLAASTTPFGAVISALIMSLPKKKARPTCRAADLVECSSLNSSARID